MNKDSFRQAAPQALRAAIIHPNAQGMDTTEITVERKDFSTGSQGWFANTKMTIMVNGEPVKCQVNVTITAVGSKEWK